MELYFLRHGLAGQHGDPKYKDDSLRPLTAKGRKELRCSALGMQALGLTFDVILSSPFLRARQTAEIISEIYKIKKSRIHLTDNLLPPASVTKLLREVNLHFPKSNNILLVGHEPHLTAMMSELLNSHQHLAIDFKKGGLCCLSIDGPLEKNSAVLNWLLTPAQLALMA